MASSTPSAIISDAITSLTQATTLALNTVGDQARLDVARANSETRQARNRRDEALSALRTAELGQANHEQQLEGWKAAVSKADLNIKHQAETISQLRDENAQWKEKYAKLEETCQQWKDRLLRVEQERYRLSTRLDELVSSQLSYANKPIPEYYRSQPSEKNMILSTASTSTKHGSTPTDQLSSKHKPVEENLPSPPQKPHKPSRAIVNSKNTEELSSISASANANISVKKSVACRATKKKTAKEQYTSLTYGSGDAEENPHRPRTQLIRRVQAVIEVPVKAEDEDDGPQYNPTRSEQQAKKARTTKAAPSAKKRITAHGRNREQVREKSKSWQVWRDPEYRTPIEAEDELGERDGDESDGDGSSEPGVHVRQRKNVTENVRDSEWDVDEDDEDDEDELIMGAEDNQEVYGTRSFPPEKLKSKPGETDFPQHGRQQLGVSHGQHVNAKKRKSPDGGIAVKTAGKVVKKKRTN